MTTKKQAVERILSSTLSDKIRHSIVGRLKILKDKGCWIINDNWDHYAGNGLHRKIFEAFNGEVGSNRCICHKCDRPGCINPDHLFKGTNRDNTSDAIKKGRRYENTPTSLKYSKELRKLRQRDRWNQLDRFAR